MTDFHKKVSVMGVGFIGGKYCSLYPEQSYAEQRDSKYPKFEDVLYTISTTSNYNVLNSETRKLDIETNLSHLVDVLPNITGTFNFTSSWFCYGFNQTQSGFVSNENSICKPNGFYSITKYAAEQLIRSYCDTVSAGLVKGPSSYKIFRLCNVIGNDPRANKQKNALEYILKNIIKNEDVSIYEGDNYRNYLHVEDVCEAINICIKNGEKNSIYNIGDTNSIRLIEIVNYVKAKTESKSKISIVPTPKFHTMVQTKDFWMDTSKILNLGFKPKNSIWQSIDKVLEGIK